MDAENTDNTYFNFETENEQESDLYEHLKIVVDKGQALVRIDKFLTERIVNSSRNKIQVAAQAGNILVNEKPVKSNYRIKPYDVISVVFAHPPRDKEIKPENIALTIVYEDDDIVIINKKPGMVVHPGFGNYSGTLVNALLYHFTQLPTLPNQETPRPGLVHRLDKNTSGIMVLAKNELAMSKLAKQFFDRTIDRKYIALVWGNMVNDAGTITGHIGRDLKNRKVFTVFPNGEYGKHAITHYKVIERLGYVTLIECKLETGRTHQIRVHLKYAGHTLFNDNEYGGDEILKGTTFAKYKQFVTNCFEILPRVALHAKSLGFTHPKTGEWIFFDSDLPTDMQQGIEKWRNYSQYTTQE
ncbi:MAG: RluA family pseudouridine synthase [Bacteroidia bacterium]|nr:RluA family pseudouridine synthase [Bacteroidia bacterium]